MPQVPVIPGSYQVNTPNAGVQANFNALDQPNRVDAATGATIGQIGRELGDFAIKLQEGVNYGIAAETDAKMRQTAADFQQSLIGRTDEDQWENQWAEKSNQVWQNIQETNKIGPSLRRRLTANFKEWQASNAIEVKTVANKQRINRSIERVGLAADQAARDGDENGVMAAFDGAVENHLMLPEEAAKAKMKYGAKIDEYAARNYIMANPAQAVEFIGEKDKNGKYVNLNRLTPDDRLTLLNTAKVNFTKYQAENYQDLIDGLNQGQTKTPEELQLLVDQKVITPKQFKSYQGAYRHGGYNTSTGDIASLFSDLSNYDPTSDPKFERRAELLARVATGGFPQNVQSEMNGLLQKKTDAKDVLNSPVAKQIFQDIEQRFKSGFYGKYQNTILNTKTGETTTVTDYKKQEEAMAKTARVQDFFRQYIQQNPTATQEQANRAVAEFQIKETTKAASRPILNTIGVLPVPSAQEDAAALKTRLDAILSKSKK